MCIHRRTVTCLLHRHMVAHFTVLSETKRTFHRWQTHESSQQLDRHGNSAGFRTLSQPISHHSRLSAVSPEPINMNDASFSDVVNSQRSYSEQRATGPICDRADVNRKYM